MCASQDEESDEDDEKQAVWMGEDDMWQVGGVVVFATPQDIEQATADDKFWRTFEGKEYSLDELVAGYQAYKAALDDHRISWVIYSFLLLLCFSFINVCFVGRGEFEQHI